MRFLLCRALSNLDSVRKILTAVGLPESLMQTVTDRLRHDRLYALSSEKLTIETDLESANSLDEALRATTD